MSDDNVTPQTETGETEQRSNPRKRFANSASLSSWSSAAFMPRPFAR